MTARDTTTGDACAPTLNFSDDQGNNGDPGTISKSITKPPTTPTPTPSCSYYGPDPQGNSPDAYCVCDGSLTYPELPGTSSCKYSTLPLQTTNPIRSQTVITTNCQVCTQVNANEDNCSVIPGCTTGITPSPVAPTPTPTLTPRTFYIGYTVTIIPGGGDLGGTSATEDLFWEIFSGPTGGSKVDLCGTPDFGPGPQIFGDAEPNVSLGPFTVGDRTDCTYVWNKPDKIGGITCGNEMAVCRGDDSENTGCNGNRYYWVNRVTCNLA